MIVKNLIKTLEKLDEDARIYCTIGHESKTGYRIDSINQIAEDIIQFTLKENR